MRVVRIVLRPLILVSLLAAETPKLPEPYQSIADLAGGAPVEFAADALLRLVESGKIADKDAKIQLVTDAFHLAASAKFKVKMRRLPGSIADTRSGYLASAYDLKLDAMSLQSRATIDMLPLDAAKGRKLFREIVPPELPALSCDDPLVYDLDAFYRALGAVSATFSAAERAKEEHMNFLLEYLGRITSAAELAPMERVIKIASVTEDQREIVQNRFDGLLESMQPDARSFAAALPEIGNGLVGYAQPSLEKFKQRSAGCPDDAAPGVALETNRGAVQAGSTPHVERYWESAEAKKLLVAALSLRYTPEGKMRADAERSSKEWQQQLSEFMSALAAWTPNAEKSEADYYHQKCVIYEMLVELIPPGEQRDETLQSYVSFVSNSNLQQSSPVEWFMHVHSMLDRVRSTSSGEPGKVLAAFEASGNRVLALYAALEKAFAGTVPPWVTKSN